MSKVLASYLEEGEAMTSQVIAKLEDLSGYNSEDVRLISKVKRQSAEKIYSLGLDPADTTGEELHQALQAKLKSDLAHLARAMNLAGSSRPEKLLAIARHIAHEPEVMALKTATAKQLMRQNPPKKSMKALGYRSLESMLKRESGARVAAYALTQESASWLKNFDKDLYKLTSSDFEWRKAELVLLADESEQPVTCLTLFGSVVVWSNQKTSVEKSLQSLLRLMQALQLLEVDSFYLSVNKFNPNFGRLAAELLSSGLHDSSRSDLRHFFSWSQIRQIFEQTINPIEKVAQLHPALNWWRQTSHLRHEGISLNLADNLGSLVKGSSSKHHQHCVDSLKTELLMKYCQYDSVKNYFMSPFDDTLALSANPEPVLDFETA